MKIAIHHIPGSFSDGWIKYCKEKKIEYKLVCCYDPDIMEQLEGCKGLMWNWGHVDYKAVLFARQLIYSLNQKGIKTFPDTNTCWHFDDKVGQKYLFEAFGAPLIKTYVFYSRKDAMDWIGKTSFPKVFKLRGGAAALNVRLVRTPREAAVLIKKAFGKGFKAESAWSSIKDRLWQLSRDRDKHAFLHLLKGFGRLLIPTEYQKFSMIQKGYVYFQDFVSGNNYDTRIVVIGDRCFGMRRYVRKNDFRASGSGLKDYDARLLSPDAIRIAFETAGRLKLQCVAFDFVVDKGEQKIVEMSYNFPAREDYGDFMGYYDKNLVWHDSRVEPEVFIMEGFLNCLDLK